MIRYISKDVHDMLKKGSYKIQQTEQSYYLHMHRSETVKYDYL